MLDGFRFHRLLSVPHRRDDPDHQRSTSAQLVAAFTAAYAELADEADRPAIALAWERLPDWDQLRVLVGGRPFFPPAGKARCGGQHPVRYPPGAQGGAVTTEEVLDGWARIPYWVRCPGQPDPLWTAESDLRRGGFDDCVAHLISPFVWLVVAEPLPTASLEHELGALAARIPRLRQRENSELDRVALERAQGRYRELSRARAVGLWAVHVLVGADTAAAARSAAAVLCSSGDLDSHPYVLLRGTDTGDLDHAWHTTIEASEGLCSPFPATGDVLAALARPPRRELPGIRLIERAEFDLTPEHTTGGGIGLGEDVGNDQDKAFFIGTVLIRLYEHLRVNRNEAGQGLQHITVIEEAHRLLKRVESGSPAAHAVELFTALLAETRAYGEGIVVAEQIPAKIVPDVLKNTALKIIHRLPAGDDRADVGATMNLDETQSRQVASLPPGVAAVFADGMDRPMRIAVPLGEDREDARSASHAVAADDRTTLRLTGDGCYRLRELSLGARLADDPRLIVWIELLTAAHLVGRPEPAPRKWWLDDLRLLADRRTLGCAIALRVQSAVDDRYTGLVTYYQPESLADHLVGCARDRLDDVGVPCAGSETEWQAGRHRWTDIFAALAGAATAPPGPHPETSHWARRGLHLPEDCQMKQLIALRQHPNCWLAPATTITGSGSCAQAVARLSRATDPKQQLREATAHLDLTTTWPLTRGPLRQEEPR